MEAIVKWPGGKAQELKYILNSLPENFNNYYEPFVGGGSVFLSLTANRYFINDKSEELISLYQAIANQDEIFYTATKEITNNWDSITKIVLNDQDYWIKLYKDYANEIIDEELLEKLVGNFFKDSSLTWELIFPAVFGQNLHQFIEEIERNFIYKITRTAFLEKSKGRLSDIDILKNIETAFKGAYYMYLRHLYNSIDRYKIGDPLRIALFLFIRNYAYSGMFRYNRHGGFNVPYGGIGYNKKSLSKKISHFKSNDVLTRLVQSEIFSLDFEDFFNQSTPTENDFIFLDPPYDTEFSEYAKNVFGKEDHTRLANYLIECPAKWMLIIKNTEFINALYNREGINISSFEKKYQVSFMNRNNKTAEHLLIKNY